MKKISVSLHEKSYPIYIGSQILKSLAALCKSHGLTGHALVVSQKSIWNKWGKSVRSQLSQSSTVHVHLTSGKRSEQSKSIHELLRIIKAATALDGRGQSVFVVALGGGVIGDVAGFASAIYRRGIPLIQIPTTLTAQVDSSIGGKNGVDLPQGKNLLGTITQPKFVLADPSVLSSLPQSAFIDGLAEVVKYALIRDAKLFGYLEKNKLKILSQNSQCLAYIIARCAHIKAQVVAKDEWDRKGVRMILNFGHTTGHALEAALDYHGYTHGQAVSIGMIVALGLSQRLNVLQDLSIARRTEQLLSDFGLPTTISRRIMLRKVMTAMKFDKKTVGSHNRFVLLERMGRTRIQTCIPKQTVYDQIVTHVK